jgi:hypothetical protein
MRWLLSLALCFLGSLVLADENPTKVKPKPEDFLGKWSGKWDDKWQVRFTITQDPKTNELKALYEYEQYVGKPLRRQQLTGKLEGNTLRVGRNMDLTLSPNDPDKGKAVGNFLDRLTANLVRRPKLLPVPDQDSQRKALAAIKETLKGEFARAKAPAEREALAKDLLKYGVETEDDPIACFVILQEARDQAVDVAAFATALAAIDEMARWYKINPLEMKAEVLTNGAKLLPAHAELLARHALRLVDAAIADDQYELADRMGSFALTVAGKTTDGHLLQQAKERVAQIPKNRQAYRLAKASLEILKDRPNDPEANLTAGKFLCFDKEDWAKGLPLLAKGSDKRLSGLASQDAATPKAATDQVKMADAWFQGAGSDTEPAKYKMLLRAHYWYLEALPNLGGLSKAKVIKRLDEIEEAIESSPLPKPKPDIHIVADIDGSDTLRISAYEAVWTHRSYQWPSSVEINDITWKPAAKPQNPKVGTWPLLGRKVDFATATLTKLKGRGTVALKTEKDLIEISFDDPPFGSDTYEVVVTFGQTKTR